jgi:hypothetical protein
VKMNHAQEQEDELAALAAIFDDVVSKFGYPRMVDASLFSSAILQSFVMPRGLQISLFLLFLLSLCSLSALCSLRPYLSLCFVLAGSQARAVSDGTPKKVSLLVKASDDLLCTLNVTYVPTYPEEVPLLSITGTAGLDEEELAALNSKLSTLVSAFCWMGVGGCTSLIVHFLLAMLPKSHAFFKPRGVRSC